MQNSEIIFPQYRAMSGRRIWYKIHSFSTFDELQQMGERVVKYSIEAEQYPEKLRILDMLSCQAPFVLLEESVYLEMEKQLM